MAGETPSFSRLVFGRAIADTWRFFEKKPRDMALVAICVASGFGVYWLLRGLPVAMDQLAAVAAFTFGPIGFVVVIVFLWHLWLAPSVLAYEGMKTNGLTEASKIRAALNPAAPSINWVPWKLRSQYTLSEFAKILAKTDPAAATITTEGLSYLKLLLEELNNDNLTGLPTYGRNTWGDKVQVDPNYETEIERDDALEWAESKKFDVSHIK